MNNIDEYGNTKYIPDNIYLFAKDNGNILNHINNLKNLTLNKYQKPDINYDDMVAVTCYFNPRHSIVRKKSFDIFYENFNNTGINLYTIEAAIDNKFELNLDTNYIKIDITKDSIFFIKENLLNIIIKKLPLKYDKIIWIDCDIIGFDNSFYNNLLKKFKTNYIIQLGKQLFYLNEYNNIADYTPKFSAIYLYKEKGEKFLINGYPGLGWAARREVLDDINMIYDRNVTGGGDTSFCYSTCNIDYYYKYLENFWSKMCVDDVKNWGQKLKKYEKTVDYLSHTFFHLYHGDLKDRKYRKRHIAQKKYNFDPLKHLEKEENGLLKWSNYAPVEFKEFLYNYIMGINF